LPGGLFCKADAKVYRISVPTKCFEDYFSKNLKITQSLDTNQPKQHPKHLYRTSGSHKNKKIALQSHKTRKAPLYANSKTKEVSILAKNNKYL